MSKNSPPLGYIQAAVSLDQLFDLMLQGHMISRETYDHTYDFLLNQKYMNSYVKKIRGNKRNFDKPRVSGHEHL